MSSFVSIWIDMIHFLSKNMIFSKGDGGATGKRSKGSAGRQVTPPSMPQVVGVAG